MCLCSVAHHVQLFVTPWTIACQAPLSMGFPRQEYWSGFPFSSPKDLPHPGIKPASPALQVDSLPVSHQGSPKLVCRWIELSRVQTRTGGLQGRELGARELERQFALCVFFSVMPCKYITYEKTNALKVKTQRNLTFPSNVLGVRRQPATWSLGPSDACWKSYQSTLGNPSFSFFVFAAHKTSCLTQNTGGIQS